MITHKFTAKRHKTMKSCIYIQSDAKQYSNRGKTTTKSMCLAPVGWGILHISVPRGSLSTNLPMQTQYIISIVSCIVHIVQ